MLRSVAPTLVAVRFGDISGGYNYMLRNLKRVCVMDIVQCKASHYCARLADMPMVSC